MLLLSDFCDAFINNYIYFLNRKRLLFKGHRYTRVFFYRVPTLCHCVHITDPSHFNYFIFICKGLMNCDICLAFCKT